MALSRLLRRARDRGQACVAVPRSGALPATLRCCRVADGYQLELHLPEDVLVDQQALREMFALTPSEAGVAAGLCDGLAPADLAARLGVQVNTVQAHIKRALAKTGCRRQVELVALLLRSAARSRSGHADASATRPQIHCAAPPIAPAAPGAPGDGA
ncbi:MAG: helix-turn-helix transcriptional regulator [Rubrivivax sp.]|nr:helix-turn-helix transcriptional regulator [Rubrivivax sp.]